jgi:hypothetical protein
VTQPKRLGSYTARQNLMTHSRYRYRGCAPDVDDPQVAAGDNGVPVTAWEAPDVDGGEAQADRVRREQAAIDVCMGCAVWVECAAYGASLSPAGKLAVPHGILGGMTALERHKAFVREQVAEPVVPVPAPVEQLQTEQKLAVLRALAVHADPGRVAAAAGVDVRTANWQRTRLTTQLGLPRSASRRELLAAAVARGLLRSDEVVADPGGPVRPVQLSLFPQASRLGVAA